MSLHPSKTRLAFADEVVARRIRWYNHEPPVAHHTMTGRKHTSDLDELVRAELAFVPACEPGLSSIAELTPEGMAWVTRARTADSRNCERCTTAAAVSRCCSSHGKNLCHRCYRQTHFVEVCVAGCSACAREGLPREMHYWESGPVSTSPETGPAADECQHTATERQGEAIFCADCGTMTAGPADGA